MKGEYGRNDLIGLVRAEQTHTKFLFSTLEHEQNLFGLSQRCGILKQGGISLGPTAETARFALNIGQNQFLNSTQLRIL